MNIETVLQSMEKVRATLDQWGVTNQALVIIAIAAGFLFVGSLREVLSWFLKVHTVRSEIRGLREQTAELQKAVHDLQRMLLESEDEKKSSEKNVVTPEAPRFHLDH